MMTTMMTIAVLLGPIVWSAVWCLLGRWVAQCSLCDRPCDLFRSPVGDDDGVYDDGDDDNDGDGDDGDVYNDYYDDFTFHCLW